MFMPNDRIGPNAPANRPRPLVPSPFSFPAFPGPSPRPGGSLPRRSPPPLNLKQSSRPGTSSTVTPPLRLPLCASNGVSTAWRHIAEPSGARLCVIAIHTSEGRLVALWPMIVHAYHRLWRRARQLCASWDYNDILIDPSEDLNSIVNLAWQALTRASGADLIALSLVPGDSPLHRLLAAKGARVTDQTTIDTIAWDGIANWQSYYRNISDRAGWDRRERRLCEQGEVVLRLTNSPDETVNAIRWMLAQKRLWLDRKGKSSDWLHLPGYENFLVASVESLGDAARMMAFTLTLNGQLIGVQVSLVDEQRMFCHHTAFDPAFARFSPGIQVLKFTLKWAFERRLRVDLGYGHETNKTALANGSQEVADFVMVNSAWGQWHQALKRYKGAPLAPRQPGV
jgi:CelD/BcsL family acetyltransferase involved in cellulose biosynthesis